MWALPFAQPELEPRFLEKVFNLIGVTRDPVDHLADLVVNSRFFEEHIVVCSPSWIRNYWCSQPQGAGGSLIDTTGKKADPSAPILMALAKGRQHWRATRAASTSPRTTTGPMAALTLRETMLTLIIRNEEAGSFRKMTLVEGFLQGVCSPSPGLFAAPVPRLKPRWSEETPLM